VVKYENIQAWLQFPELQTWSFFNKQEAAFPLAAFLFFSYPSPDKSSLSSCTQSWAWTISAFLVHFSFTKTPIESHNSTSSRSGGSSSFSGVTIGDNKGLNILHTPSRLNFVSINNAPAMLSIRSPRACRKDNNQNNLSLINRIAEQKTTTTSLDM